MLKDNQKTAFGYVCDALVAYGVAEPKSGRRWMKRAVGQKTLPVKKVAALQEAVEAAGTPHEACNIGLRLLHEMVGLTWEPLEPSSSRGTLPQDRLTCGA